MALRLAVVLVVLVGASSARAQDGTVRVPAARADEATHPEWTGRSAIPLAAGHGSIALFSESRFGVARDVQLGTHLAGLVAPHASVLYRFFHGGPGLHAAVRLGIAYPTPMLALLTGQGTGALLPADTKPPQALMLDLAARFTIAGRRELVTFEAAAIVAPRFTHTDSPVLDFPFLYPRFAALDAPITARFAATGEGAIAGGFRWVASLESWLLPVIHRGFAVEPRIGLAVVARRHATFELGGRGSYARYPVGLRWHATPYVDVRVGW